MHRFCVNFLPKVRTYFHDRLTDGTAYTLSLDWEWNWRQFSAVVPNRDLCKDAIPTEPPQPRHSFLKNLFKFDQTCAKTMRLHHIVGGSTGPGFNLFCFHDQEKN